MAVIPEVWAILDPGASGFGDVRVFVPGIAAFSYGLPPGGVAKLLCTNVDKNDLTLQNLATSSIEIGNGRDLQYGQGLRIPPNSVLSGGAIFPGGTSVFVVEKFAKGTLPAPGNQGRLVELVDFDRALWIDDGTLFRSVAFRFFDVTAYGAKGDGVTDDGPAFTACFAACAAAGGGKVIVPIANSFYRIATRIVADDIRVGIRVEAGVGTTTGKAELRWVGAAGSGSMLRGDGWASIHFIGITFSYSSALYDGDLVKSSHSGTGVDSTGVIFERCEFYGIASATARSLLSLSAIIISVIRDCAFNGAVVAIRLADPSYGAGTTYSDSVTIEGNTYNNVTRGVRLGGTNIGTRIRDNTFEPSPAGAATGVDTDAAALGQILTLEYEGNWHGDVNAVGGGQWLSLTSPANRGIAILNNHFDTIQNGEFGVVLGVGSGAMIHGNSFVAGGTGLSLNFSAATFDGVSYRGNFATGGCVPTNLANATSFHADDAAFTSELAETYANHRFRYEPLNINGINPVNVGTGGTVAFGGGRGQLMSTGVTNPSSASQRIVFSNSGAAGALVGKVRRIAFDAYIADTFANARCYLYITEENVDVAPSAIARHLGVKNLNGVISFTTADGAAEETTNVTAFVTAATEQTFVIMFDGTTARLFIDGVQRAAHSTHVPAGGGGCVLRVFIDNNATANARGLAFYAAEVTLAA